MSASQSVHTSLDRVRTDPSTASLDRVRTDPYSRQTVACLITVGIVDDHEVFRMGLRRLLARSAELKIVWELGSGADLLATLVARPVDAVLLDYNLGTNEDSIALTRTVIQLNPGIRVVMMSALIDPEAVSSAQSAGAVGYLAKDLPASEMLETVRQLVSPAMPSLVLGAFLKHRAVPGESQSFPSHGLTRRENQVLVELRSGRTNREIASRLGVSITTVNKHVQKVLRKLRVKNRGQAIARLDAEALGRNYRTPDSGS